MLGAGKASITQLPPYILARAGALEGLGPVRLLTCPGGQGGNALLRLPVAIQLPTSNQILTMKKGALLSVLVLSLAAVPSTQAVSVLELGQHLRVEAVPSSNLLDLRQKSY